MKRKLTKEEFLEKENKRLKAGVAAELFALFGYKTKYVPPHKEKMKLLEMKEEAKTKALKEAKAKKRKKGKGKR